MRTALSLVVVIFLAGLTIVYLAGIKPQGSIVVHRCDLAVSTTAGILCFDRTDGNGRRIPFTESEREALQETLKCVEKFDPNIIDPDPRGKL